ncbi:hypothetical protein RN001_016363 [Aquatica leii]|uniref:3-dehydrosphinganine reductase n=1 Tax=Aquatica leii TaxID=1421715 RepID=A0AAN7PN60_9COLE|nr:hypothetical protein RN001_016363 [Aquatica leii]
MFFLLIPVIFFVILKKIFCTERSKSIANRHVVITGGSSGIGRSVAILAAKEGAHVTIIARDIDKLKLAEVDVKKACINNEQQIQCISLDVTNSEAIQKVFNEIDATNPIYMLVNCAGKAVCGKLEDMSTDDIKSVVNLNLFGTVFPTQCVIPKMKSRKEGIIVISASQAALIGIFGMSVYTASKYALRGFAEAIDMELHPYEVTVTVAVPPDTDTPGFENENKSKPEETMLISNTGGLFNPDVVAGQLLKDALKGKFFSYVGFESFICTNLSVGMTRSTFSDALIQAFIMGPIRIISLFYLKLSALQNLQRKGACKRE